MLEGVAPFASMDPYDAAKAVSNDHRPDISAKTCTPGLERYVLEIPVLTVLFLKKRLPKFELLLQLAIAKVNKRLLAKRKRFKTIFQ